MHRQPQHQHEPVLSHDMSKMGRYFQSRHGTFSAFLRGVFTRLHDSHALAARLRPAAFCQRNVKFRRQQVNRPSTPRGPETPPTLHNGRGTQNTACPLCRITALLWLHLRKAMSDDAQTVLTLVLALSILMTCSWYQATLRERPSPAFGPVQLPSGSWDGLPHY